MRRLAPVLLLGVACAAPETTTVTQSAALDSSLVAAYDCNEGSGSVLHDLTSNHLDGKLGGQTWTASGKFGGALNFGSSGYVTVPDDPALEMTGSLTLEAWVYPTKVRSSSFQCVLLKERPGELAYSLYAQSATNNPEFDYSSGTNTAVEHNLAGGRQIGANAWTHLAATYDGATMRLYVNGAPVASRADAVPPAASNGALRIGGNSIWGESFTGRIDEIRIYNRALSAAEITTDMNTALSGASSTGTGGGSGTGGTSATGGTTSTGGTTADDGGVGTGGSIGSGGSAEAGGSVGTGGSLSTGGTTGTGGSVTTGTGGTTSTGGVTGTGGTIGVPAGKPAYPLKQAAGQRHLVDQNGAPFLLVGDSAWSLAVSVSTADADAYLADRQAKGFNSVLVNLIEHKFAPNPPRDLAGDLPFTGKLSNGARDFTTPNEAYFAHVDSLLQAAAARGILVQLVPAYLGYNGGDEGWYAEMQANGTSRLSTYGTYVGNRYKNFPNIIWVAGADYNPPDKSLTNAVENAIRAADPNHLHTAHANNGTAAQDEWGGSPWLTVNTIYGYPGNGQQIYSLARAQYTRSNWMPFYLIESTYEHSPFYSAPATLIRQQAYEAILNGGFGENVGNEWVWPFGVVGEDGASHAWRSNLQTQGAADQGRLAALFGSRAWFTLAPDFAGTFLTSSAGSGTSHISAALAGNGKLAVVYSPGGSFTLAMSKLAGAASATWYDPSTGTFSTVSGSPLANSGSRSFTTPGSNGTGTRDWVLLLEVP
jgi:hypothetical protein